MAARLATLAGVVRGGPVKRSHMGSVRLTPGELAGAPGRQRASRAGRVGAAVVNDAAGGQAAGGRAAGDVAAMPEVNGDAYRKLAAAAPTLNHLARVANAAGQARSYARRPAGC